MPFVPGAALVVRRHLRFDPTLQGGEDVEFVWRVPYARYAPDAHVAHDHRTDPGAWFKRRVYYGRTAAGIAKRHPGKARPLNVSPWTTAAWLALAARRPVSAAAILGTAAALAARELDARTAVELAGLGSLRSGRVVADALTRPWWPLAAVAAARVPRTRLPLAAALATKTPLQIADDLAYGIGLWQGCVAAAHAGPAAARQAVEVPPHDALVGGLHRRAGQDRRRDHQRGEADLRAPSTIKGHMSETALRAAVVGAGPSGFYATDQLLKAGFEVDLLEVLPTPFGLVRAGVAP